MNLDKLLHGASKAQLQGYFLHWFPGSEVLSSRDKLTERLLDVMVDAPKVRRCFDVLPRSQQGFIISLLLRDGYSGTVEEVREQKHGKVIEDFEVEGVLKTLQEAGYIVKTGGTGGYASEVFSIPQELATALRRTVAVEERHPLDMLSLRGSPGKGGKSLAELPSGDESARRIESLPDATLAQAVARAMEDRSGILTHSMADGDNVNRQEWRTELERREIGTTGVLSLKNYGIDLEEEGLFLYQEIVYHLNLAEAQRNGTENDRELSLGADLVIDLDRVLEVLRSETLEVTREGNVYKKIEERIAGQFVMSQHSELNEGSSVNLILELARRLHFFEEEGNRITPDPLRRRIWRKKPFLRKLHKVFEIYRNEHRGKRWSFHQAAIREIFLEHLLSIQPGNWLVARPFLFAVINKYLLLLEETHVATALQERCTEDFRHETLVVPFPKLHHDLSYWIVHRLALLGLIDIGYVDGAFHSLKLSQLGLRYFKYREELEKQPTGGNDEDVATAAARASRPPTPDVQICAPQGSSQILVNPDFEILIYPEAPAEASWMISFFADRVDSDRVKRYRLTRESLKRGIVAGLTCEEILQFLEGNVRGTIPPNVSFSLREWTEGVQLVRRQKVTLLRATSASGTDRLSEIMERSGVPFERLNDTTVMVRSGKNERAVDELQEHFRDSGLFVE